MNVSDWLGVYWADDALYFFVGGVVSVLLVVLEVLLLRLRERAILGHLGWKDCDLDGDLEPRN